MLSLLWRELSYESLIRTGMRYMVSYRSKRLGRFPISSGKVPTIDASVKLLQNPWPTKWEVIDMFKELEHRTQFNNLVHYNEVTDLLCPVLVWTLCLMHRCVCIWRYILQNYNYKLHFQNLSIYHIPHVFMGPWSLKILMFALLVTREIATYSWRIYFGFVANIDIKILGVPPLGGQAWLS
jgi:hypothetical protein